jgi:hypothetical protein
MRVAEDDGDLDGFGMDGGGMDGSLRGAMRD